MENKVINVQMDEETFKKFQSGGGSSDGSSGDDMLFFDIEQIDNPETVIVQNISYGLTNANLISNITYYGTDFHGMPINANTYYNVDSPKYVALPKNILPCGNILVGSQGGIMYGTIKNSITFWDYIDMINEVAISTDQEYVVLTADVIENLKSAEVSREEVEKWMADNSVRPS